jgi:ABC-type uncharacterized transport system permease subunit
VHNTSHKRQYRESGFVLVRKADLYAKRSESPQSAFGVEMCATQHLSPPALSCRPAFNQVLRRSFRIVAIHASWRLSRTTMNMALKTITDAPTSVHISGVSSQISQPNKDAQISAV